MFRCWEPQIAGQAAAAPELFLAPKDHSDLDLSIGKRSKGALWKSLAQGSTGPVPRDGWHNRGIPGNHLPYQTAFCCRGMLASKFDKVTHEAPNYKMKLGTKTGK